MNPEPDWRLPNGDLLPDCRKDVSLESSGNESTFEKSKSILLNLIFHIIIRMFGG